MFAVLMLEPGEYVVSFKCSPEDYAQLVERPGVSPAPYLARAHWVALENFSSLPPGELRTRLGEAHALVFAKLPKRVQAELNRGSGAHRS